MANIMYFDGPCPFLTCLETGPHEHPVCPECGAVRYGNLTCNTCRRQLNEQHGLKLNMLDTPPMRPCDVGDVSDFMARLDAANG